MVGWGIRVLEESLGWMWLVHAGEYWRACGNGDIREGRWASCVVGLLYPLGSGRQAPRSPRWTRLIDSAQHWRGAQPTKTSDPGRKGEPLAEDPGSGCSHCLGGSGGSTSTPGWSSLSLSASRGSKLSWSNIGGWLKSSPSNPAHPPQMRILTKLLSWRLGGRERLSRAFVP